MSLFFIVIPITPATFKNYLVGVAGFNIAYRKKNYEEERLIFAIPQMSNSDSEKSMAYLYICELQQRQHVTIL